ncbi:MAG: HAD family phosphatase [Planctomycetaceae bacterium]|nr:HAD family phosphatase [Planctomycetaceae bacterium]
MTRSKIRAVAFDMDGLMFDTEALYNGVGRELMRRRGYDYPDELCHAVMGTPPEASFTTMINWHSLTDAWQELQQESDIIFLELVKDGFNMMPGLPELLAEIERLGLPKAVCTSSAPLLVEPVLATYQMAQRFDFILTADDVAQGKPNPEIYLKAAARFGIDPAAMMVLEDSVLGTEAALAAGACTFTVLAEHNQTRIFPPETRLVDRLNAPEVLAVLIGNDDRQ